MVSLVLKYFSEDSEFINSECDKCKRILRIGRYKLSGSDVGYSTNAAGVKCPCGEIYHSIQGKSEAPNFASTRTGSTAVLKCPKCGSTNFTAVSKGFGLGKAAAGGLLLGPVGLLGGLFGSKKPLFTCLNCGKQFKN